MDGGFFPWIAVGRGVSGDLVFHGLVDRLGHVFGLLAGEFYVLGLTSESGKHHADAEKYRWLNDAVCSLAGEVRPPADVPREQVKQADVKLVFSVADLVWEAPPE
jgi:hypothetical protein